MKVYTYDDIEYYGLREAAEYMGIGYYEVYHNYWRWEHPLGLMKFQGRIYVRKSYADYMNRHTAGYVPQEYASKRMPFRMPKSVRNLPDCKVIRRSVWVLKLS